VTQSYGFQVFLKDFLYTQEEIAGLGAVANYTLADGSKSTSEQLPFLIFEFTEDESSRDFANTEIFCDVWCDALLKTGQNFDPDYNDINQYAQMMSDEPLIGFPFLYKAKACIDCHNLQLRSCQTLGLITEIPVTSTSTTTTTADSPPHSPEDNPAPKKRKIDEVFEKKPQ